MIVLALTWSALAAADAALVVRTEPCPDSPNVVRSGRPCPAAGPFFVFFEPRGARPALCAQAFFGKAAA